MIPPKNRSMIRKPQPPTGPSARAEFRAAVLALSVLAFSATPPGRGERSVPAPEPPASSVPEPAPPPDSSVPAPAPAPEPIYVSPNGKDAPGAGATRQTAFGTIQAALDAAPVGGEVILLPGTYTGPGNENLTFRGKDMTLRSEAGRDATIIRGFPRAPYPLVEGARAFVFDSGETALSVLEGITITGFNANGEAFEGVPRSSGQSGGIGLRIIGASPVIRDCMIRGNYSRVTPGPSPKEGSGGAGVYINGGSPSFYDTSIVDNVADATSGSGINCTAGGGAGMFVQNATVHMERCSISRNRALTTACSVATTSRYGGAFFSSCTVSLIGCTVADNSAVQFGGIYFLESSGCMVNCTVSGNNAVGLRAIAGSSGYSLYFDHCTIVYNAGNSTQSVAIQFPPPMQANMRNCIVAHNDVTSGGQVGTVNSLGYNIFSDNAFGYPRHPSDRIIVSGILSSQSLPIVNGQVFPLVETSPAIDTAIFVNGMDLDQTGSPRARDGDGDGDARPDVGAFEIQNGTSGSPVSAVIRTILGMPSPPSTDANLDGVVDIGDGLPSLGACR